MQNESAITNESTIPPYSHGNPDPPSNFKLDPHKWQSRIKERDAFIDQLFTFAESEISIWSKGAEELATKIETCGTISWFSSCGNGHGHAVMTSSCASKLCPVCAAKTSAKRFATIVERTPKEEMKNVVQIVVTFKAGTLEEKIPAMKKAVAKFLSRKYVKENYPASLYSIEAKPSKSKPDLWHVHAHVLAISRSFITQKKLAETWKEVSGGTVLHINHAANKVGSNGKKMTFETALAESIKYISKLTDLSPKQAVELSMFSHLRRFATRGFWSRRTPSQKIANKIHNATKNFTPQMWTRYFRHSDGTFHCECGSSIRFRDGEGKAAPISVMHTALISHAVGRGLQPTENFHRDFGSMYKNRFTVFGHLNKKTADLCTLLLLQEVKKVRVYLTDDELEEHDVGLGFEVTKALHNTTFWKGEAPLKAVSLLLEHVAGEFLYKGGAAKRVSEEDYYSDLCDEVED